MYKIRGRLQGTADLLFNLMTAETEKNLRSGATGGKFTDDQRTEEAKSKYPVDPDGNAIISNWMFKRVLADGAKAGKVNIGRKSLAPFLIATVFVEGYIHLTPNIYDYIIKRPAFRTGWKAEFTLNVLDDGINADQVRASLEAAGIYTGLGSWRPEYGRFIVTEWEVMRQ
jgi:hypothetical protein